MSLCKKIRNCFRKNQETLLKQIFLLCLISIMGSVFLANVLCQEASPSDADSSLVEKVFEKYQTFLLRVDIQVLLPIILEEIMKPENQELLSPNTINLVVDNPDLLKIFVPDIEDEFITLFKEDEEIRTFLTDADVQALLQNPEAIDELAGLIEMSQLPLLDRFLERYQDFFQRQDVIKLLPNLLEQFKTPANLALLQPETLTLVVENPDYLKEVLPKIDDAFITLLKEDAEAKALISDPDFQQLLQEPAVIDALTALLNIKMIVRIVPASVESPQVGKQLIITVDIANGFNVAGYQGTVQFDPTALQYVSLTHGTYLSGQVVPVPTKATENQVTFAQTTIDTTAKTAEGTLVTITFDVLEVKASMLTLSNIIIGGFGGTSFPVVTENAEILEPSKPWDVNNDGFVNILDLTFVASYFGKEDAPPAADVNRDGNVNILDLTLVASHFGE